MKTGNRGQVLLVFIAALLGLLGIAALGIDIGYLYSVRHELQRSTDAGALAGASAFLSGDWDDISTRAVADVRARDYASRDPVVASTLDPAAELQVSFPSRDRVRVDATRTANLFFARLFLGPTRVVTAYSVAEASVVSRNVKGLAPWGIPYPWNDVLKDGIFDPATDCVYKGCDTDYPAAEQFCHGARVILKAGIAQSSKQYAGKIPSIQQESGHYFALDFGASGGAGYNEGLLSGSTYPVSPGDDVPVEPGALMGPTLHAVRTLIFDQNLGDPGSQWNPTSNLPHSEKYPSLDGKQDWMSSPRIVRIPIYDPSEGTPEMGKGTMKVAGFAGFWIDDIDNKGTIIGRFVKDVTVTGSGGPSEGPLSTPVLRNLRLVE